MPPSVAADGRRASGILFEQQVAIDGKVCDQCQVGATPTPHVAAEKDIGTAATTAAIARKKLAMGRSALARRDNIDETFAG